MSVRSMSSLAPTIPDTYRPSTPPTKWQTLTLRSSQRRSAFFNDEALSDITIAFSDQKIFAHKFVLVENSIWFEKALLGDFKESKQNEISLGGDDDPAILTAMLRYFYDGDYDKDLLLGDNFADRHLAMYRLADLYDVPDLRKDASDRLLKCLVPTHKNNDETHWNNWGSPPVEYHMPDKTVLSIQKILGPDADSFADKSVQEMTYNLVTDHAGLLYKNVLFQELLADGSLFNESFNRRFIQKTGEIIVTATSRDTCCHRNGCNHW